ncbi:hypothetical protein Tco_0009713 [Tanacetum coccineum]
MLQLQWKVHLVRNMSKAKSRDSKSLHEQSCWQNKDEAGVKSYDEQNNFLFFADASRMEDLKDSERVRVLENINGDNNYLNEFLEANKRAKHFSQQAQSQFVRDRDIIRDLEKQRDKLDLDVKDYKRQNEELQKTHSILKRQMSENEDKYHDTVLDLEAKLKKNVDLILKLGNSLQGMFMLGPKPLSVYDQQLKHGLGYPNPYTLKQAISQCPKLYLASSLGNSEISLNVRDTEDTLDDASKSQQKVYEKMNDPIAVANKQNCWTIDYAQINALYKDFVPQKELSAEQKYFPSSFIPSDKNSNATPSIPASMPSESPLIIELDKIKNCFQRLSELIQKNCKRASIFYTSPEEIQLNDFCQDQLKPIVNELQFYFEFFKTLFQRDIKEMKDVFESTENELYNSLHAEIEQLKKKSIENQEGLQARIKILEKDVQRCEKQSVDFELKLQPEKEKHKWDSCFKNKNTNPLDYSWISKMEKLEDENVSLDFTVQSLIKERENVKLEYQKLFNSIKKTRSQTQTKIDELIAHVSKKTYAYGAIRAENQNLLFIISELKTRLANVEKGMNSASSVRRPMNRDSHVKNSVLANSKKPAKKVAVYVRKNKQTDNTSEKFHKTRFSKESTLFKSLETTYVVSKLEIDVRSTSKANNKFESKPNVIWSPINTKPNGQNSSSSEKQSISVKKWVVKLPTCPCAVSSCAAGLGHNLFSVGQFCDGDLEVAFHSKTCYVRNLEGDDLLTGGHESNVLDLVDGLPKFKYGKDHLCSACERGKSKKASHPLKLVPSDHSKLELLHMDLCGPMRVASINGKKKLNVEYFHVFGSLCYPKNDRDDLGKMKPKADIGVFIGYSETSRGFQIYNRRTKKIMETIHVKFNELTAMASEHDCLEPELQRFINHNSSAETMNIPSKDDLDNLFDSPSTSSIIIDEHEAPPIVTTSDKQTFLISLTEADEFNQEDSANFDGNSQFVSYNPPSFEEIESSTTALE